MKEAIQQIKDIKNFKEISECGRFLTAIAGFLDIEIDMTMANAPKVVQDYVWHMKNVSGALAMCHAATKKHLTKRKGEEMLLVMDEYKDRKLQSTQLKMIVESRCATEIGMLTLSERLDARMSHVMDLARSTMSLYKTELDKGL
jgi:hypothetical protein